jgi:hypothetical protein
MSTISLQRLKEEGSSHARTMTGASTGVLYNSDALGRVTVDISDAPELLAKGWVIFDLGSGLIPSSGIATLDFGAFPGSSFASVSVVGGNAFSSNAHVDAWVAPVATVDHSVDEHQVDPPLVSAIVSGSNIVINGYPSGRDLAVPPGTPFGNTANSQLPIGNQQLMPYGKWSVGWALAS